MSSVLDVVKSKKTVSQIIIDGDLKPENINRLKAISRTHRCVYGKICSNLSLKARQVGKLSILCAGVMFAAVALKGGEMPVIKAASTYIMELSLAAIGVSSAISIGSFAVASYLGRYSQGITSRANELSEILKPYRASERIFWLNQEIRLLRGLNQSQATEKTTQTEIDSYAIIKAKTDYRQMY